MPSCTATGQQLISIWVRSYFNLRKYFTGVQTILDDITPSVELFYLSFGALAFCSFLRNHYLPKNPVQPPNPEQCKITLVFVSLGRSFVMDGASCNPYQSSPSLPFLFLYDWFIIISFVFFCKLIFSVFFQTKLILYVAIATQDAVTELV